MTMHLEGPWMTTTKYSKKAHKKWASSAAKKKAEHESLSWIELQGRLAKSRPNFSGRVMSDPNMPRGAFRPLEHKTIYPPGREPTDIPSRPDTPGTVAARPADKMYTGTKMRGIGMMHKSNLVPVFSDDEAREISSMRR